MRLIKWILPITVLALAAFGFIQLKNSKPELPAQTAQERAWRVSATRIDPQPLSPQIQLYAETEHPNSVRITAAVATEVTEVRIREGSRFSKGDLLLALNTQELDLEIAQQQAQLNSLRAQLESEQLQHEADKAALQIELEMIRIAERALTRQRDLSNRSLTSQENLDTAEMNVQQRYLNRVTREQAIANHPNRVSQLQASIDQAQSQIERLTLDRQRARYIAPFDGRVGALEVALGDRMRVGDPLAVIYPSRGIELRAQLPLTVLPMIKQESLQETPLLASLAVDGEEVPLELDRLAASVSSGRAGLDGLFTPKNDRLTIEPGRTLALTLTLPEQPNLVALPPDALYGTDRIYSVVEGRLQSIKVEHLGNRSDANGQAQVLVYSPDLKRDDQVITTQLPNAVSGIRVEVVE